jgi:YVTN family beta-propeller protein
MNGRRLSAGSLFVTAGFVVTAVIGVRTALAQTSREPAWKKVTDPGTITTGQKITPAGVQAAFQGRTYGVAFGSNDDVWALTSGFDGTSLYQLSWRDNRVLRQIKATERPGTQSLQLDPVTKTPLFGATSLGGDGTERVLSVRLMGIGTDGPKLIGDKLGRNQVGAIAVARQSRPTGARLAVVPLTYNNRLAVVDVESGAVKGQVPTEIAPFGAVINAAGTIAYVSNWGGRAARPGEHTLTAGNAIGADSSEKPGPDAVVVDSRGVASTGSVTRVDLTTMHATQSIEVGLHPTSMAWDEGHSRLYVANGNSDSVSVIDTTSQKTVQTIAIQPFHERVPGLSPTAVAIDQSGRRLYVACGGINAIAVYEAAGGRFLGLIPTPWYPNALALSPDGTRLAVSALLGIGSGWRDAAFAFNRGGRHEVAENDPKTRYVHANRGTVNVIEIPDAAQLASYTAASARNTGLTLASAIRPGSSAPRAGIAPVAIPQRVGEPSLIDHVVYIIKENRTYDQYFGDLQKGNGDPSLLMYGPDITPNHHRLANEFVLLDNFYATGGNSGDGHQWATQANETEYTMWPGYAGRSYPYGGDDPIAVARGGGIWDAALAVKKTVEIFGEYVGYGYPAHPSPEEIARIKNRVRVPSGAELIQKVDQWRQGVDFSHRYNNVAPNDALNAIMVHDYPAWGAEEIPDVIRAQVFTAHVKEWERTGKMPNLVLMHLPSDHTEGTAPGRPTPRASVADNDWALGLIVEALTHSAFWKSTAIFVVEDDAQAGVDHVDGHRTVALAVSPFIRKGTVDSTFYAQQGMLKTMELILGLPALSIFDLTAAEMRASFHNEADLTPYTAVEPKQSITELNPPLTTLHGAALRGARDSMKMRFDVVDAAPSEKLNRILWHDARGWNTPYPGSRTSAFFPLSRDVADDDRDERDARDHKR